MPVAQSCPTLCDPVDCSLQGSSVHGNSPGKNTGVGCHSLLQGIFPTRGLNPSLPHCRWILCQLSHSSVQVDRATKSGVTEESAHSDIHDHCSILLLPYIIRLTLDFLGRYFFHFIVLVSGLHKLPHFVFAWKLFHRFM